MLLCTESVTGNNNIGEAETLSVSQFMLNSDQLKSTSISTHELHADLSARSKCRFNQPLTVITIFTNVRT